VIEACEQTQAFFTTKDTKSTKERRGKRSSHAKIAKEKIIAGNVARNVLVFAFFAGLSERSERAREDGRPQSMQKN